MALYKCCIIINTKITEVDERMKCKTYWMIRHRIIVSVMLSAVSVTNLASLFSPSHNPIIVAVLFPFYF